MKRITLNLLLFANSILLIMYMALAINRNMAFNATGTVFPVPVLFDAHRHYLYKLLQCQGKQSHLPVLRPAGTP